MGFPILVGLHLYIESRPCFLVWTDTCPTNRLPKPPTHHMYVPVWWLTRHWGPLGWGTMEAKKTEPKLKQSQDHGVEVCTLDNTSTPCRFGKLELSWAGKIDEVILLRLLISSSTVNDLIMMADDILGQVLLHDDVIKWKHFPRYWPFVRGIHRSPVVSPHKDQWRGALMVSLICAWTNGWVNNLDVVIWKVIALIMTSR